MLPERVRLFATPAMEKFALNVVSLSVTSKLIEAVVEL
jgi:hypothetical protein